MLSSIFMLLKVLKNMTVCYIIINKNLNYFLAKPSLKIQKCQLRRHMNHEFKVVGNDRRSFTDYLTIKYITIIQFRIFKY